MTPTDSTPKRSFWWSLRGFFAAVGALLTTAVAVVGLFLPQDDHSSSQTLPSAPQNVASPTALGGEIVEVHDAGSDPCCTFAVQVELVGFNGRGCVLSAVLVDALDGSEIPAADDVTFTSEADTDRAGTDVPVAVEEPGSYSVRFVLTDPDGVELDRFETEAFDVG
jgi:hypothetical protein